MRRIVLRRPLDCAGSSRTRSDGQPCNWTLGGLFTLHKLEVITEDGQKHPRFEVTSSDHARSHAAQFAAKVGAT